MAVGEGSGPVAVQVEGREEQVHTQAYHQDTWPQYTTQPTWEEEHRLNDREDTTTRHKSFLKKHVLMKPHSSHFHFNICISQCHDMSHHRKRDTNVNQAGLPLEVVVSSGSVPVVVSTRQADDPEELPLWWGSSSTLASLRRPLRSGTHTHTNG